jgi:competence protein ComEC
VVLGYFGAIKSSEFEMKARRANLPLFILGILIFLNILSWIAVWDFNKSHYLEVVFFNVGQGDAIFIETPQKHQILIDGGPGSVILERLAKEMPFYDRSLDLVILTHPEADHMLGLIEVLKRYQVEYVLWTGIARDTPEYKEWKRALENEKADIRIAQAGQTIKIAKDIYLNILRPRDRLEGEFLKNSNNTSIVSRLVFKNSSFLFTGDISEKVEEDLVASNFQIKSNILKVAHHGSKTSSSDYFLEAVSPGIAVIQVGKNSYGHPTEEVLSRLRKIGIKIFRTDKEGDIKIISDGNNFKVKSKN